MPLPVSRLFLAGIGVLLAGASILAVGVATAGEADREYMARCPEPVDAEGRPFDAARAQACERYLTQRADGDLLRWVGAALFAAGLVWAFLAR